MARDKLLRLPGIDYSARAEEEGRALRAASSPRAGEPSSRDTYGIEQAARAAWERSAAIREEFTSFEAYCAFKRAEARGAVRIISRGT